ncbi:MAG: pyridoxamine 5'-phosphate oxidase [Gemmatimonadales bacterium]|nr:pyridoxamine 5'-phosphate oxidase [Gemmatimonadales bacterium]
MSVEALRRSYRLASLDVGDVADDPADEFGRWFQQAREAGIIEPNAMTLATIGADGHPDARVVLLKAYNQHGFSFFTNYTSAKATELATRPHASLVFWWDLLERQVRIRGHVTQVPREESEAYFAKRPRDSQLGAWASAQSSIVPDRATLERQFAEVRARFEGQPVPCPPFWGGYHLRHETVEFWQGRESRLHDRIRYVRAGDGWRRERLAP